MLTCMKSQDNVTHTEKVYVLKVLINIYNGKNSAVLAQFLLAKASKILVVKMFKLYHS